MHDGAVASGSLPSISVCVIDMIGRSCAARRDAKFRRTSFDTYRSPTAAGPLTADLYRQKVNCILHKCTQMR